MADKKVTKSDRYAEIRDLMVTMGNDELAEFAQKEIDSLAAKAEKARARAAEKAAEVDEYRAIVAGALTDDLQTGADIFALVGDEDFSIGKVRARLTALVRSEVATKEEVSVEVDGKTKKVMAYRLA